VDKDKAEFIIEMISNLFFELATDDLTLDQAEQLRMIKEEIIGAVEPSRNTSSPDQPTPDLPSGTGRLSAAS
jgi:hypothetical protein